jgi:hypothetical protein
MDGADAVEAARRMRFTRGRAHDADGVLPLGFVREDGRGERRRERRGEGRGRAASGGVFGGDRRGLPQVSPKVVGAVAHGGRFLAGSGLSYRGLIIPFDLTGACIAVSVLPGT